MAGDWLKFEANTPEKPEVFAITAALGWDDPDLTVGKLLKVWRWFDQHTLDGNALGVTPALLDRLIGVSGLTQAMADVGWVIVTDAGLQLPKFDRHNGKTAKDRALTAKRVAKHKTNGEGNGKGNADANGTGVSSALPREEKRRRKEINKEKPMPEEFAISERVQNWAKEKDIPHIDRHFEYFVGVAKAKGYTYVDWDEAFMRAVRDNWAKLEQKQEAKKRGVVV